MLNGKIVFNGNDVLNENIAFYSQRSHKQSEVKGFRREKNDWNFDVLWKSPEERNLTIFLLLNVVFMGLEFVYGFVSNSLSLISDSVHMLFDVLSLAIGLFSVIASKWPSDNQFTYGYGRFQILGGFTNGILLVFISIYILFEAIHRMIYPPVIQGENLMIISVLGLIVNIIGMVFFYQESPMENQSVYAIYLHMVADTLGSLGIIFSTFLVQRLGYLRADPICSILIAALVLSSSFPLLKNSLHALIQGAPAVDANVPSTLTTTDSNLLYQYLQQLKHLKGVSSINHSHFWILDEGKYVGTLHITKQASEDHQALLKRVQALFGDSVQDLCIQISEPP